MIRPKEKSAREEFLQDVLAGLSADPKHLSCKYFYDEYGSKLFDRICELEEYYPTRTEMAILEKNIAEIADVLGPECMILEPGSGTGMKTKYFLEHLDRPVAYVPIESSREFLEESADRIDAKFESVEVLPVHADFHEDFEIPTPKRSARRKVLFFPGSTIGNFVAEEAVAFLKEYIDHCGPDGGILIGVDLKKDKAVLERAYNDSQGVTAAFNMNLLRRINHELEGDFLLRRFRHEALYNEEEGRIEMYLQSACDQVVHIGEKPISFMKDERILTEYSHKYSLEDFRDIAEKAGARVANVWMDDSKLFSVQYLTFR
jgi:dimethylhistidine N-methyltransferase